MRRGHGGGPSRSFSGCRRFNRRRSLRRCGCRLRSGRRRRRCVRRRGRRCFGGRSRDGRRGRGRILSVRRGEGERAVRDQRRHREKLRHGARPQGARRDSGYGLAQKHRIGCMQARRPLKGTKLSGMSNLSLLLASTYRLGKAPGYQRKAPNARNTACGPPVAKALFETSFHALGRSGRVDPA